MQSCGKHCVVASDSRFNFTSDLLKKRDERQGLDNACAWGDAPSLDNRGDEGVPRERPLGHAILGRAFAW
jgi:hypothetical protein